MFLHLLEVFVLDFNSVINTLVGYCISYGGRLLVAGIVLLVGFWLCNMVSKRIRRGKTASKIDRSALTILLKILSFAFKTILVITAISIMGVPMSSVITVIATIGAAIGLALQGSLSNLAGGIMLLIFKPFRVGDIIETQEHLGKVSEIGLFYTVMEKWDNRWVTFPNGALMNSTVTNYSSRDIMRADVVFGVSYDSDIDHVRNVLLVVANAHPLVLQDPEPTVYMIKQDDSALIFKLRPWCKSEDYWKVQWELTEAVKKAFDKTGIEIPFQQVDVHLKDDDKA